MNGKVAKQLRRQARQGNIATPIKTKWYRRIFKNKDTGEETPTMVGTNTNTGFRAAYLKSKREYKRMKQKTV